MNYVQNAASSLGGQYQGHATPSDHPQTELESIHEMLRIERDRASKIADRVGAVLSKLRGAGPATEKASNVPTAIPNGLLGEMQETLAHLAARHGASESLLEMIETAV